MTKEELLKSLKEGQQETIITQLFSGVPYAFRRIPADYNKVKAHLGAQLGIESQSIVLVGSGLFGFSMAPHKYGQPFHAQSDLDFVIVDSAVFDVCWMELIRYDFKSLSFDEDVVKSLHEHRKQNIFWGYIEPYNLKNALSVYKKWFPAFAGLGMFTSIGGRRVKARIYRTWEHARSYHRFGLRLLTTVGENQ